MENQHFENTVIAAESEVFKVSEAAVEVAIDEDKLETSAGGGAVVVSIASCGEAELVSKRKRGRPRKQAEDKLPEYSPTAVKRARGRPRGSGKWQTLAASLGGNIGGNSSAGSNLTPYTITIQAGENIVERIWSFSQVIPDSICILSASGTISTAEIFLPASRGGILRYEGRFTIVYLNGSHTYDERRGGKKCVLSVQLANTEGRFYGGAVAGALIAAAPTQIIIATFRQQRVNIIRRQYQDDEPPKANAFLIPLQTESVKVADGTEKKIGERIWSQSVAKSPNTKDASEHVITSHVQTQVVG